ncbi:MAG: FKBP-type peptidyl-prolyl cis-trans isomerase [Thermoleophilia bacterium]|nr:FKBP-type peptidyl-prolyl cis-trans isomerase [Thermoleophilia bacterium]
MDRRIVTLISASALLAAIVVVVLVAGGGSDESGGSANCPEVSKDTKTKPTIGACEGTPPTALESIDVVEGDGAEAKSGDKLSMQYVGTIYDTGKEFDASWDRGEPFDFDLGAGNVIKGWDQGIEGMKVGGRRELIIPPDLGYGPAGQPPSIPANATLVFVVDLLDVK